MRIRYLTNTAVLVAGAFLVVASQAFALSTFMWLMFGCGIGALALGAASATTGGVLRRGLDGAISVLGAWTIVASMVFAGATVTWLGFAAGIGLFALAMAGLTLNELRTERVVHSLEVSGTPLRGEFAGSR